MLNNVLVGMVIAQTATGRALGPDSEGGASQGHRSGSTGSNRRRTRMWACSKLVLARLTAVFNAERPGLVTGSPASRQAWKPPSTSVAKVKPSCCSVAAAKLDW
jgi:hypothetical protein